MKEVSCIVPAYNEEKGIAAVLTVLGQSPLINEIIVVDDGSRDKTAAVVKEKFPQVKLIIHRQNRGKADALYTGVEHSRYPILFFCDADLIGLQVNHLEQLIAPVASNETRMVVGTPEYMNTLEKKKSGTVEMNDFVMGLGGQKVLAKKDFLAIGGLKSSGYGIEQKIIAHFRQRGWPIRYEVMYGVGHVHKIKKWGLIGLVKEAKAILTFAYQWLVTKLRG